MLTSPVEKSYIGQTIHPIEVRFQQHQRKSSNCVAIYNAIQKYGWENIEKNWYEVPDEDLNKHEELMIEVLGTLSPGGYNLKEGGSNGKLSEETRQKISEAQRGEKGNMYGKTRSDDTKQKISEASRGEKHHMYGKTHSEEVKQKMSEAQLGKTLSKEHRQKLSEARRGKKNHMFGKTGERHPRSKKVYQYDLDGICIRSFGSCGEAADHLGKTSSTTIWRCAGGDCKTAYGFKWSYNQ